MGIADGTGHHPGQCICTLADNPHQPNLQTVPVEGLQAELLRRQVYGLPVLDAPGIRRINVAETLAAEFLIAPALLFFLHRFRCKEGLHILCNRSIGLQAQGIEHQVRDLVVVIHHQHRLIIAFRPVAVKEVILVIEQRIHQTVLFSRQHLLPHIGNGVVLAVGGEEAGIIPPVDGAHGFLQKLHNIRLDDVSVRILGVEVHIQIIAVLYGADIVPDAAGVCIEKRFEVPQIIRLLLCRDHGIHQVIHDGTGINRITVMPVLRIGSLDSHE